MKGFFGFDTSNYTTSAAFFSEDSQLAASMPLPVEKGAVGLRQSDALFLHVKQMPDVFSGIQVQSGEIAAVGASTRPRSVEDSYMPCFLAGESYGRVLARALAVPFYAFSHQQGHIAAAAWSSGHMELLDMPHLAWHLSGGTTELLMVTPDKNGSVVTEKVGGTSDLSAGQLIDRTGKLLGLDFPAGKALDALLSNAQKKQVFAPEVKEFSFSLSGVQNKAQDFFANTKDPVETAYFVMASIYSAVEKASRNARSRYPGYPILFTGGVAANSLLRDKFKDFEQAYFAKPEFSTDNAMGAAILASRQGS